MQFSQIIIGVDVSVFLSVLHRAVSQYLIQIHESSQLHNTITIMQISTEDLFFIKRQQEKKHPDKEKIIKRHSKKTL